MTDILIRYMSVSRKPRFLKTCSQCAEPCYPGLPRYRLQLPTAGVEVEEFLHLHCATKWLTKFVRENRDELKKEGVK